MSDRNNFQAFFTRCQQAFVAAIQSWDAAAREQIARAFADAWDCAPPGGAPRNKLKERALHTLQLPANCGSAEDLHRASRHPFTQYLHGLFQP